jgi:hypothetical protein
MKNVLSIILFAICSFNVNLFGQIKRFEDMPQEILEQMDKMGVDDCPLLTELESNYFNILFQNYRKDFDFTAKKIAFITGSSGTTFGDKKEYFEGERISLQRNSFPTPAQLLVFNDAQKAESNGYDAVIAYWCKVLLPVKKAVKTLKKRR